MRVRHDWATSLSLSCTGEGNGNPLQCSCLENPWDGGAWWTAVYGVTQSRTLLTWLSSSSMCICMYVCMYLYIYIYIYIYIYFFFSVLGHHCSAQALRCCSQASPLVAPGLSSSEACGFLVPHQRSTLIPCIGRQILSHWTTREPCYFIFKPALFPRLHTSANLEQSTLCACFCCNKNFTTSIVITSLW